MKEYSQDEILDDIQAMKRLIKSYITLSNEFDSLRSKYMPTTQWLTLGLSDMDRVLTKIRDTLAITRGE